MKLTFVLIDVNVNLTKINKEVKQNEDKQNASWKGERSEKTLVQGRYGIVPAFASYSALVCDFCLSADVWYYHRV